MWLNLRILVIWVLLEFRWLKESDKSISQAWISWNLQGTFELPFHCVCRIPFHGNSTWETKLWIVSKPSLRAVLFQNAPTHKSKKTKKIFWFLAMLPTPEFYPGFQENSGQHLACANRLAEEIISQQYWKKPCRNSRASSKSSQSHEKGYLEYPFLLELADWERV